MRDVKTGSASLTYRIQLSFSAIARFDELVFLCLSLSSIFLYISGHFSSFDTYY